MVWRQHLQAVDGEEQLVVRRLLGPERTVVVEDSNAVVRREVVGASLGGGALYEVDDRRLGRRVIPGCEWCAHVRQSPNKEPGRLDTPPRETMEPSHGSSMVRS